MLDDVDFRTIGIVGTGLMGGSFGKAIKKSNPNVEVIGFDKNEKELNLALEHNCIDRVSKSLTELGEIADLIVLATPVRTYEKVLLEVPTEVWEDTWLTDLGSVKSMPHEVVERILPKHTKFIGGHPMAGSEKCGCQNGSEDLFEGATFYLTAKNITKEIDTDNPVKRLVESLGAVVKIIDPHEHDRIVSVSSHVPHVTASMLVQILHDDISINETGGGYQDTTRIAGSDPIMWTDIMLTNKEAVLKSLGQLHSEIHKLMAMIEREDEKSIFGYLEDSRDKRLGTGGRTHGNHNRRKAI